MIPQTVIVIKPNQAAKNYWRDLWRYRELMYFLAWRDILVRYKQTALGVLWALLKPGLTMLVFVAFRRISGIHTGGPPDPILVFSAVLPWQFFSTALTESSGSLIGNVNLISKVYFPRLIVPSAAVVTSLVDFFITVGLLGLLMAWYGFMPGWQILLLPLFTLLTFALSIGAGLLFAALNVEYRDFRYIIPFVVQFGVFVSPIAFRSYDVPERWRFVFDLNPLVGIIDGFRWSILRGETPLDVKTLLMSIGTTAACCFFGIYYFRRMERTFADVI